jgi:hypothetical protein
MIASDTAMNWTDVILLAFLAAPHILLGTAWLLWASSWKKLSGPPWRRAVLLSGLVACSLAVLAFWAFVLWMRSHHTDLFWWQRRDEFEIVVGSLSLITILAALIGQGRGRLPLILGGFAAYFMWIVFHVGVL